MVEEGDSSRLDALGAVLLQTVPRLVYRARPTCSPSAWSRILNKKHLARCAYWDLPRNESVFDIAITGSTSLRLGHQEGRGGGGFWLVLFPVCGVACGLSRCPERGQGQDALTDQTVEAGGLVPRCNKAGRTLGGRDRDKMTDCPMVFGAEGRGGWNSGCGRRIFRPFPRRRRYNHAQQRPGVLLMSD